VGWTRKDVKMSNPADVVGTSPARLALSGWVVGLALAVLAFGVGFVVVWNQDTEQVAPVAPRVVVQEEDPRLKYEFEGGVPVTPRVVVQEEDPRLKHEFEGGAPVAEPRAYRSTSGNPLE
jgi:hypothetical protein